MGIKSVFLTSALLLSAIVNAETVVPSDYMIAGKIGDTWNYENLDSTQFTWTLSVVAAGPNAGRFERGNIDSGMVYDLANNILTIHEWNKIPIPPSWGWVYAETELGQVVTLNDDPINPSMYLFLIIPSITVQAGTFSDVLVQVWLDANFPANNANILLGLDPLITAGVTDVNYFVPGFGEVEYQGVDAETGNSDGLGYELVSTTVKTPTCDIQMSQLSYIDGETVTANVFRFANLSSFPIATELKIWLGVPGIPPLSVTNVGSDGSLVLPAGIDVDYGPIPLFPVTGLPRGEYELSCRMLDPITGELLVEDRNFFDITFDPALINGSWISICELFEEEPTFVAYERNIRTFNDVQEHILSEVFDTPDCSGVPRYSIEDDRSYEIGGTLTANTGEIVYKIDFTSSTGEIVLDIFYIGTDTLTLFFGDDAPADEYPTDLDFEYVYTKLP